MKFGRIVLEVNKHASIDEIIDMTSHIQDATHDAAAHPTASDGCPLAHRARVEVLYYSFFYSISTHCLSFVTL